MERTRLAAARNERGWSQEYVASSLGVDRMTVQRWEQNRTTPQLYHLERLCKLFGQTAVALGLVEERLVVMSNATEQEETLRNEQLLSLIGSDLTLRLVAVAFGPFRGYQVIQNAMMQIIEEDKTMNENSVTRREALRRMVTLPLLTRNRNVKTGH